VDRLIKEKNDVYCKARDKGCEWKGSVNDYTRYVSSNYLIHFRFGVVFVSSLTIQIP